MLPRWFPNVQDPADGNFIEKHILSISQKVRVKVLFVKGLKSIKKPQLKKVDVSDMVQYYIYYFPRSTGLFAPLSNIIKYFRLLQKGFLEITKETGLPSIIHVHVLARTAIFAHLIKKKHHIPFLVSEHWSGYLPESNKVKGFKQLLYKFIFKNADQITCVSEALKQAIKNLNSKNSIHVIPNVIEDVFLSTEIKQENNPFKHLLHISNLIKDVKQSDKILIYLNELAENRQDFDLTIIGEGKDRADLEELTLTLSNLKDRVSFTGDILPDDLCSHLKSASATLSYSRFETQSIVLIESFSMGVPVIAPQVGGIPEHCADKGILFNPNSKAEFIKAVNQVLDNKFEVHAEEWRNYAVNHFSSQVIANKFIEIYKMIKPDLNAE